MLKTKFLVIQMTVETELEDGFDVDSFSAIEEISSAIKISDKYKKHDIKIFELARKPNSRQDAFIEEYNYKGFLIEICQNAGTVGSDTPTYYAVVYNLENKSNLGKMLSEDALDIAGAKEIGEEYADKRRASIEKKTAKAGR